MAVSTGGATRKEVLQFIVSPEINIDNGAGTTQDIAFFYATDAITIDSLNVVYTNATAGTVAAATVKVGITVGGAEIVTAVALTNDATVGSVQALTILDRTIPAGTPLLIRHTGIATTVAGQYVVQMAYAVDV